MDTIKTRKKYLAFVGAAAVAGVLLLSAAGRSLLVALSPKNRDKSNNNNKQIAKLKTLQG
jgi:hypothetical protein